MINSHHLFRSVRFAYIIYIALGMIRGFNCFTTQLTRRKSFTIAYVTQRHFTESYLPNHRFWIKTIELSDLNTETVIGGQDSGDIQHILSILSDYLSPNNRTNEVNEKEITSKKLDSTKISLPRSDVGLVLVPSHRLFVAMHNGLLQPQHAVVLPESEYSPVAMSTKVIFCGFSPRAQHVVVAPSEEERPIHPERLMALTEALQLLGTITGDELMSETYAGTPPARIYRSFVSPRAKAVFTVEPIERAAKRTAEQIEMALRQVRADNAAYLRNTDKALDFSALSNKNTSQTNSVGRELQPMVLVLDNIRSAFNVGSMFRTAETAGIAEVITCGITAHPPHPKLRKTAFSSIDTVPSRHFDDVVAAIAKLRSEGYYIAVMETTAVSKLYTKVDFPKKVAFVVGNEITGVDARVIEEADVVIEIPTFGIKNSLNVASAAPIVMFETLRQWGIEPSGSKACLKAE